MSEAENKYVDILIGAVEIAALFAPISFLYHFVLMKSFEWSHLIPLTASFLTCFATASATRKRCIAKILLSIPFSILFEFLLINSGFYVRSYNFWFPGYGTPSDFVGLALVIELWIMLILELLAFLIGIFLLSRYNKSFHSHRMFWIIKNRVCLGVCLLIGFIMLCLDASFPSMRAIYRSTLGG